MEKTKEELEMQKIEENIKKLQEQLRKVKLEKRRYDEYRHLKLKERGIKDENTQQFIRKLTLQVVSSKYKCGKVTMKDLNTEQKKFANDFLSELCPIIKKYSGI